MRKQKPTLGFWQIWNMCFGFLGIQFGFALQNANVSRIFQSRFHFFSCFSRVMAASMLVCSS